jgi:hypothetical protein
VPDADGATTEVEEVRAWGGGAGGVAGPHRGSVLTRRAAPASKGPSPQGSSVLAAYLQDFVSIPGGKKENGHGGSD